MRLVYRNPILLNSRKILSLKSIYVRAKTKQRNNDFNLKYIFNVILNIYYWTIFPIGEAQFIPKNVNSLDDGEKSKFYKKICEKKVRGIHKKADLDEEDLAGNKVIVAFKCPVD